MSPFLRSRRFFFAVFFENLEIAWLDDGMTIANHESLAARVQNLLDFSFDIFRGLVSKTAFRVGAYAEEGDALSILVKVVLSVRPP